MATPKSKDLDVQLRRLRAKVEEEQADLTEEQRKLFEFEEGYLRETLLEGNILLGWGEPRTAPVRFRNAALRRKKRERQDADARPAMTTEERGRVDRHRLASFSSVTSPAEPIRQRLEAEAAGRGNSGQAGDGQGGGGGGGQSSAAKAAAAKKTKK